MPKAGCGRDFRIAPRRGDCLFLTGVRSADVRSVYGLSGRTQCRTASGVNEQMAVQTAKDNACAYLVYKNEGFLCNQTPPARVTCQAH